MVLAVVLALGLCGCVATPPREPSSSEVVDPDLAAVLEATLPDGSRGTLVAAIDDQLVHCAGFGSAVGEDAAPSCDTVYDVMSMSKQFTAAAILKLQMMGKLTVDDPISRFFPSAPAVTAAITVRQLLTHTAGLAEALGDDYDPVSRDELVEAALASTLVSAPGAEHHYSNVGYSLLAAIIEVVAGASYETFLARELFEPAGMHSTGYVLPDWDDDLVAIEYDAQGDPHGRPFEHPWSDDGPYWNLLGNGGLLSTARDLFQWHVALQGDAILDAAAKTQLFEPAVREEPDGESFYAFGWAVQETRFGTVASHDGGNAWSFGILTRLLDQGIMLFWITNQAVDAAAGVDLIESASDVTVGAIEELVSRVD
jgi:CubicO group peptidase (beta-lactamase class C family)